MKLLINTKDSKRLEQKANRLLQGKNKDKKVKIKKAIRPFLIREINQMNIEYFNKLKEN